MQQAQRHIESLIDLRRIKPGGRLPPSAQLAEQAGVSRPAVLQALKILGDQKRVIVRPGRGGTWVAGHAPSNLQARVARAWEHRETIIQMGYLRQMLEQGVARRVAERGMSPQMMVEARRMSAGVRPENNPDREERRACDTELHLLIARANEYSDEHEALLDAIERRDPDAAADIAYRHSGETTRQLEAVLLGPAHRREATDPALANVTAFADALHLVATPPVGQEGGAS